MTVELVQLPGLAVTAQLDESCVGRRVPPAGGSVRPGRFEPGGRVDRPEELAQGLVGPERTRTIRSAFHQFETRSRIEPGDQGSCPVELGGHGPARGRRQSPRRRPRSPAG